MAEEDLYANDAAATPGESETPAKDDAAGDEGAGEEKQEDVTEAVLPKSILAGKEFNVGDEVVLKITAMHDDQISVAYSTGKDKGKDEGEGGMEAAKMPEGMAGGGGGNSDYD